MKVRFTIFDISTGAAGQHGDVHNQVLFAL